MVRTDENQRLAIGVAGAGRTGVALLVATGLAVYVGREASPFAASLVLSAFSLGTMVFSPVWGAIADITRRRRLVLVGTGVAATLVLLPLTVVDDPWLSIGLAALYAALAAGFLPVMLAIVSERGGDVGRGRAIGSFNAAKSVGATGGRFFAGALVGALAAVGFFAVVAAVSLLATIAVALVADPSERPVERPSLRELGSEVRRRLVPSTGDVRLSTNGLHWLYLAHGFRNMTISGTLALMPIYLIAAVGSSEAEMGIILGAGSALQVGFMYWFGRIVDTRGRKGLVAYGMVGSGVFVLFAALATVPDGQLLRQGVVGLGFVVRAVAVSAIFAGSYAFIGDVAPVDRESELMGLLSTVKGVGGVIGPPLVGAVATVAGYGVAFASASLLAFLAAGLVARGVVESYPGVAAERDDPAGVAAD